MEIIDKYLKVAEFLQDVSNKTLLEMMKDRMERKEYLLPFIGQFSAGKSKLINHIIGRDILPTKSIETTAFLTYISYGESDKAILRYKDGESVELEVSEVRKFDHIATKGTKPIEGLYISLNIPLLKSGLVIVDTPGVNTLINEHVKMTEELLASSQYIVYVLGSSPQATDMAMIQRIEGLNIPVIFARTKVDLIKESEESVDSTLTKEHQLIETTLNREIDLFHLCNDADSLDYNLWKTGLNLFTEFISTNIANQIEEIYKDSIIARLSIMKDAFLAELTKRKEAYENQSSKSIEELDALLRELSQLKNTLEVSTARRKDSIKIKIDSLRTNIEFQIDKVSQKSQRDFKDSIEEGKQDISSIKELYSTALVKSIESMNVIVENAMKEFQKENMAEVQSDLNDIKVVLDDVDVSFSADFGVDVVSQYAEKEDAILADFSKKYNAVKELSQKSENELSNLGIEREQVTSLQKEYEEAIGRNQQEMNELVESYTPRYIQKKSSAAPIFKGIGNMVDIAMLFIPAVGWEKAGVMLAKGAGTLAKGGKLAQKASKIVSGISKGAKLMAEADAALDAAKIVNGGVKGLIQKSSPGFLDYLSASFWMEKAGEAIDPSKCEVDMEFQRKYEHTKQKYQNAINANTSAKLNAMRRNKEIMSEMQRIQKAEELRKVETQKLQSLRDEELSKLEREKSIAIFSLYKNEAEKKFIESLKSYVALLKKRWYAELVTLSSLIVNAAEDYAAEQIESAKLQIEELKLKKQEGMIDFSSKISTANLHIELLNA